MAVASLAEGAAEVIKKKPGDVLAGLPELVPDFQLYRPKNLLRIHAFLRRSISTIRETGPPPFDDRYDRRPLAAWDELDVIVSMRAATANKNNRFMAVNSPEMETEPRPA